MLCQICRNVVYPYRPTESKECPMVEVANVILIVFAMLVAALAGAKIIMIMMRKTGHPDKANDIAGRFNKTTEYLRH